MRAVGQDPLSALHLQEAYSGILQPYAAVLPLLFLLVAAAVAAMCVSTTFAPRKKPFSTKKHAAAADAAAAADSNENEPLRKASEVRRIASAGWCMIKRILVCSARSAPKPVGCEASEESARWELTVDDGAWDGYRSPATATAAAAALPLWQRKILMGERCQLPRFSGLILYDECGRPLQNRPPTGTIIPQQEKQAAAITTLKDLL